MTVGAGFFNYATCTPAAITGAGLENAPEGSALGKLHLAGASTHRAGYRARPRSSPGTVAGAAWLHTGYPDIFLQPKSSFFEGEFQIHPDICSFFGAAPVPGRPAKEHIEYISQAPEIGTKPSKTTKSLEPAKPLVTGGGMAKAVILSPFFRITQDFIGFSYFLKLGLRILIVGIGVGVVLPGQLAVSFFDFLLRGVPGHPQDFIVVALCHGVTTT
jgi:hypothetical protein